MTVYRETNFRSFLKAFSWRITGTLATVIMVFLLTREVKIAAAVGALEFIAKIFLFYLHERVWNYLRIGKYLQSEVTSGGEPFVLWFTGLPCSGKTTIASHLLKELMLEGLKVEHLDGDVVRSILGKAGFTQEERNKHVREMGYLSSRLEQNGISVIASFVSPYRESRDFNRQLCQNFVEIFVDTPLATCEARDVKGMYEKARKGEMSGFTGVDDPYEPPLNPELVICTEGRTITECAEEIWQYLLKRGLLRRRRER